MKYQHCLKICIISLSQYVDQLSLLFMDGQMRIPWLTNSGNRIVNLQYTIKAHAFKSVQLMPLKVSFLRLKITNMENVWKEAYCNLLSYDCSYLQEIKFPIIPKIWFHFKVDCKLKKELWKGKTKLILFIRALTASGFGNKSAYRLKLNWMPSWLWCYKDACLYTPYVEWYFLYKTNWINRQLFYQTVLSICIC